VRKPSHPLPKAELPAPLTGEAGQTTVSISSTDPLYAPPAERTGHANAVATPGRPFTPLMNQIEALATPASILKFDTALRASAFSRENWAHREGKVITKVQGMGIVRQFCARDAYSQSVS